MTQAEAGHSGTSDAIHCPRCGYDQRGFVSTWRETCPLNGTCAECGFVFEWRELLDERLVLPRWCVETRRAMGIWPRQFITTAACCWVSPLLWRRLLAFHPINRKRLAVWLATWFALLAATIMLSNGLMAIGTLQSTVGMMGPAFGPSPIKSSASAPAIFLQSAFLPLSNSSIGTMSSPTLSMLVQQHVPPRVYLEYQWRRIGVLLIVLFAVPLTCSLTFAALPISRKRSKVRWHHIARAGLYSCGISFAMACGIALWLGFDSWRISTAGVMAAGTLKGPLVGVLRAVTTIAGLIIGLMWWGYIPAMIIFWWAAARHYLRMPHAIAVGLSVAFVGMLAPVAVAGLTWYLLDFRLYF